MQENKSTAKCILLPSVGPRDDPPDNGWPLGATIGLAVFFIVLTGGVILTLICIAGYCNKNNDW